MSFNAPYGRHAQRLTQSEKSRVFAMLKKMDEVTSQPRSREAVPTLVHDNTRMDHKYNNEFPSPATAPQPSLPQVVGSDFVVVMEEGESPVSQSRPSIQKLPSEFYQYFEVVNDDGGFSPEPDGAKILKFG